MIKQPDFVPGESVPAPPSREAEIAARLEKLKADRELYRGEFGDSSVAQYDGQMEADLRYLLAHLQQARQELEDEYETSRNDPAEQRAERYCLEVVDLTHRNLALEAALQQAREALKDVEWCWPGISCPTCGGKRSQSHEPDCGLAAALKAGR